MLVIHAVLGRGFPYGTLAVNIIGSLLMGFLYIWLIERLASGPVLRAFLLVGVLGAFTTFSTFSVETLNLMESGQLGKAILNVLASVVICIAAAGLGILLARQL
jgi:CrcB protein